MQRTQAHGTVGLEVEDGLVGDHERRARPWQAKFPTRNAPHPVADAGHEIDLLHERTLVEVHHDDGTAYKGQMLGLCEAADQPYIRLCIIADRGDVEIAVAIDLRRELERDVEAAAAKHVAFEARVGRAGRGMPARQAVLAEVVGHAGKVRIQQVAQ